MDREVVFIWGIYLGIILMYWDVDRYHIVVVNWIYADFWNIFTKLICDMGENSVLAGMMELEG